MTSADSTQALHDVTMKQATMKRRDFLRATTTIGGAMVVPQAWAATPCPPPLVSSPAGSVTSPPCGAQPGTSVLAKLAASMAAGSWAQVAGTNQNSILTDNDGQGSGSHLHYSNSMNYIAQSDRIQIVGADHGSAYLYLFIIEFDLATNQFVQIASGTTPNGIDGGGHGYDHATVNPYTGDAYQVLYGSGGAPPNKFQVKKRTFGAGTFATALPTTMIDQAINITYGSCWWSGSFTGGGAAPSQGCLMVYNTYNSLGTANDGVMNGYNPLTNSWFYSKIGASPFFGTVGGLYHQVAEYSPALNCMVYGGGNSSPNKVYRMSSDGTVTQLTDVPAGKGLGIQHGNLVADPVTGKFLLLSSSQLWELDPRGSGTWTQQTGTRTPPTGVGSPDVPDGIMSCALPRYGVVAYIKQSTASGGTFYLYKHA